MSYATTLRPGDFPSLLLLKPNCLLCDLSITKNLPCPEKGRRFFALERAAVTGHGMELRGAQVALAQISDRQKAHSGGEASGTNQNTHALLPP